MKKENPYLTYRGYLDGILSGEITTGKLMKLACGRHLLDLKKQETDDFPYYFDEKEGERWLRFALKCNHWKGEFAGKQIELMPHQQFYFMMLFGWRRADNTRRFRTSYKEIARKNGKTTECALKALGHLILDKEPGAQVYFAATKEEQARIGFGDAQEIIKASPKLKSHYKIYTKSVTFGNSFIKPIGSDSNTSDGFDPSYGIIDEYHAHPTSGMLNVLESGMGARRQPLIDIITTAGFNRQSPCYSETRKSSINILSGITDDESHLALIFSMDEGDDWEDEANWLKANPNFGVSVKPEFLRERYRKAKNEGGSKEVDFKTKNLNIWTDTERTWIPDDVWMKCNEVVSEEDLYGMPCYAGLDLASTRDICAFVLVFPMVDGRYYVHPYFFIPELSAKERTKKDGVNYDTWIREGLMIETPGNVTDYDYIRAKINDLGKRYEIVKIGYDRYNASQLVINLGQDGFKCEPFGQGYGSMSAPTKELERLVYQDQIMHGGNPVMRWMCSNVSIEMNPAADIKISKSKSSEKVDGMVALVMGLGQAMNEDKTAGNFEITMI